MKPLNHDAVRLIVIHCSATKNNRPFTVEGLIATGKARFGQPSYHYYVRRSGDIIPILPENVQGVHARHFNNCSLGICYEGGLDNQGHPADTRTELQKHAMFELLKQLTRDYPEARIMGHCELPHVAKACPCFLPSKYYAKLQPENRQYYFTD